MMRRVTHVMGTSGGALVATVLARAPDHLDSVIEHSLHCRNMTGVEAALAAAGPDAHRADQPELVVVTASAAAPRRQRRFIEWENNEDLLACLRASCHIPAEFHPLDLLSPVASSYAGGLDFRGESLIDGGLACASPTLSRADLPSSASAASISNVVDRAGRAHRVAALPGLLCQFGKRAARVHGCRRRDAGANGGAGRRGGERLRALSESDWAIRRRSVKAMSITILICSCQ
ncbi:hypothetical protein T484DRAFT_1904683 [Baffinella frigidus]|nr:hypothetical protein T484DRAFT_1904683 [Cryptophyta sp. CCMP2293]